MTEIFEIFLETSSDFLQLEGFQGLLYETRATMSINVRKFHVHKKCLAKKGT